MTQSHLATGRKVTSAIENPNNFFAASALNVKADTLFNLLSGVEQGVQTIKTAMTGLESIQKLLELAEAMGLEAATTSRTATVPGVPGDLGALITADNPIGYWPLDDASAPAVNQGSGGAALNGTLLNTPTLGAAPLHPSATASMDFNGTNEGIVVADTPLINTAVHNQRTVELVFNADTVAGRQVLYEEGGTNNGLTMYIDNGNLHVSGRSGANWGPFNLSVPVQAGETYHVALVMDGPGGELRGYLDGDLFGTGTVTSPLAVHGGNIGIGAMNNGIRFHDGSQNGNGFYFNGRISDVAVYNTVMSGARVQEHADAIVPPEDVEEIDNSGIESDLADLMVQLDFLSGDAGYRGLNLLRGGTLQTRFNESGSSSLSTTGGVMTAAALGLSDIDLSSSESISTFLERVRGAMGGVRSLMSSMSSNLSIMQVRQGNMQASINVNREGADKLTLANMQEEGASMLALQTTQQLQMRTLSQGTERFLIDMLQDASRRF